MTRSDGHSGLRLHALVLALGAAFALPAAAATKEEKKVAELEQKLDASMKMIAQLTARLDQLEKAKADTQSVDAARAATQATAAKLAEAVSAAAAAEARAAAVETNVAQMAESSSRGSANAGVPLHGFMDVGYVQSKRKVADGRRSGFVLGNVDFYLTPEFGDRFKSLIELNFEYGEDGSLGTDLERMQFGYTFDNDTTLWAGRFHTPYGYWNTAFHHGAQIQTSILRPRMVGFEDQGGILPAHTVGLWATGQTAAGSGKIGYDTYVGNGARVQSGVLDYNAVRDDNSNKLVGGSLKYRFGGAADGLVLGVHAFQGQFDDHGDGSGPATSARVRMGGAFGYYESDDWEIVSEYYHFGDRNLEAGGGSHSSWAGFAQAGRNVDAGVMAFLRWEKARLDQGDNYFRALEGGTSYSRQALGLRFNLSPKVVLKFEFDRTDDARAGRFNEAQVQAAIRF